MTLYRDDTEDGIPLVTFINGDEWTLWRFVRWVVL